MSSKKFRTPVRTGRSKDVTSVLAQQGTSMLGERLRRVVQSEPPMVEPGIREALYRVDPLLELVWELQMSGESRWHVMKYWTHGKLDSPTHVLMVMHPDGGYAPVDHDVVAMVEQIYRWKNEPYKFIEDFLNDQERKRAYDKKAYSQENRAAFRYYRRLFARLGWGTVGSCYERGIELPYKSRKTELVTLEAPSGIRSQDAA